MLSFHSIEGGQDHTDILNTTKTSNRSTQNCADKHAAEPYAALNENNTVLTFYYDDQKEARNGYDIGPFRWKGITVHFPSVSLFEQKHSLR